MPSTFKSDDEADPVARKEKKRTSSTSDTRHGRFSSSIASLGKKNPVMFKQHQTLWPWQIFTIVPEPSVSIHRQTPKFCVFSQGRVCLARWFELSRLLRGCGHRSCCCRCLVVGKVAVVPIVLSVAVDVAGGELVRNTQQVCTAEPEGTLQLLLFIDGPPRVRRDARAFCCSGPEGVCADPESADAATEFPAV